MYKINRIYLFVFFLFSFCHINAQSIQNAVVGSAGASVSSGGIGLDYTVGETVIQTFNANDNTLTQGFHQTSLSVTAIHNIASFPDINIYPNPTNDVLNIHIPQNDVSFNIYLYDNNGKLILEKNNIIGHSQMDFSNFSNAIYYLKIFDTKNELDKTFKVLKQ